MLRRMVLIGLLLFCGGSLFAAEEVAWHKMRTEIGMEEMINAVFSPDEKTIFATDANLKLIELSAETGDVIRVVPEFKGIIQFSDDGEYVYTYNFEKRKWPTGELIGQFKLGDSPVKGFTQFVINEKCSKLIGVVSFSDHRPWMWKKGIYVFDLNTFKLIDTLGFEQNYYYSLTVTEDGKYFKTISQYIADWTKPDEVGYNSLLWDVKTLKIIKNEDELAHFKSSPDGKWLGSAGHPYVRVYDNKAFTEDLSLIKIYEWDPNKGYCLSSGLDFTHDSKYLVTSGTACSDIIRPSIWDLEKGTLAYKYERLIGSNNLKFNKKNQIFVFTEDGLKLLNWMVPSDVKEIEPVHSIIYPNPTTGEINLRKLDLNLGDLKITITDINGKEIKVLFNGQFEQQNLTFNIADLPNGMYLLKIQQNNEIKSFKVMKGE